MLCELRAGELSIERGDYPSTGSGGVNADGDGISRAGNVDVSDDAGRGALKAVKVIFAVNVVADDGSGVVDVDGKGALSRSGTGSGDAVGGDGSRSSANEAVVHAALIDVKAGDGSGVIDGSAICSLVSALCQRR